MNVQELREMVAEDPEDILLRYSLGRQLLDDIDGDPKEAVEHLEVALEHDPGHVPTYLALGKGYLRLGKDDEAREVLEEGLRLSQAAPEGDGGNLVPEFEQVMAEI